MKFNMGTLDRTLRFIGGLIIMVLGYIYESRWGLVGLVPLLTAFIGWCPLYVPFKFSTKKQT